MLPTRAGAQTGDDDIDLVNDEPRSVLGNFDVNNFGPANTREAVRDFRFPAGTNDAHEAYGIDISHHVATVPWNALHAAKVRYVYMKASQSVRSRDRKFQEYWQAAMAAQIPCGAYHFLTAGASGGEQAQNFLRRLALVGGLRSGGVHLQPVLDIEWDHLGPTFTRATITNANGVAEDKDYWADYSSDQIVATAREFIAVLKGALAPLNIRPIIYTNKSWWDARIHRSVRFDDCTMWPSDYRRASYEAQAPRSISGHSYNMWQFTDRGRIIVGADEYGPFDCNKLVYGAVSDLLIV